MTLIGFGPLALAGGPALQASQARVAEAPRVPAEAGRVAWAALVGRFGISPSVMLESCQGRCDEGEIICSGNQNTQIEQFKPRLQWVACRSNDCLLATIDHGRLEAAFTPPIPCFGSIGANDQAQACFRHINPQICDSAIAGLRV